MTNEKDEMMLYEGSHPLWSYDGKGKFDQVYEIILEKHFNARAQDNHPIFIPATPTKPRKCCLCKEVEPKATFAKEAHILAACLGNRIFFSNEECDECNSKCGEDFENHLANMTEPERGIFQIPARGRGSVKSFV